MGAAVTGNRGTALCGVMDEDFDKNEKKFAGLKEAVGTKRAVGSMEGDDFDKEKGSKKIAADYDGKFVGGSLDQDKGMKKFAGHGDKEKGPKKLAGAGAGNKAPVRGKADEGKLDKD